MNKNLEDILINGNSNSGKAYGKNPWNHNRDMRALIHAYKQWS